MRVTQSLNTRLAFSCKKKQSFEGWSLDLVWGGGSWFGDGLYCLNVHKEREENNTPERRKRTGHGTSHLSCLKCCQQFGTLKIVRQKS